MSLPCSLRQKGGQVACLCDALMSRDGVSTNSLPHSERSTIWLPMSQYMRTISGEAFWTVLVLAYLTMERATWVGP